MTPLALILTVAIPMIPPKRYIPEIHDVHPRMMPALERLLGALPDEASRLAPLLVVPDWAGDSALDCHPEFVEMLRQLQGEKVLHGLTHSLGPDWWNRFAYGTENHAEFASLSEDQATARLTTAHKLHTEAFGLPRWFCAPRWQQNAIVKTVLGRLGFEGFMLGSRYEKLSGARAAIPAICFDDGGHAWRHVAGRLQRKAMIRRWLANNTPFRLTLHPADLEDPKTWQQLTELVATLKGEGWQPLAFDDALFA